MDILYTDTDQVRGALFLAPEDLRDSVFNDQLLERELRGDLDSWLPDHSQRMQDMSSSTSRQIADLIAIYCTYWCANKVSSVAQIAVPQQIGDGKNSVKRVNAYESAVGAILSTTGATKLKIQQLVSGNATTLTPQLSIVGSAIDPVTYSGT